MQFALENFCRQLISFFSQYKTSKRNGPNNIIRVIAAAKGFFGPPSQLGNEIF